MKVCYFIHSYKLPEQIYRLVNLINNESPDSLIVVSHDSQGCAISEEKLQTLPNVVLLYGKGGRGDFLTIQKLLDGIDFLLKNKFDFDWFVHLSAQDYPVKPIQEIEQCLSQSNFDGFLEYENLLTSPNAKKVRESKSRYFYKYKKITNQLLELAKTWLKPVKILNYLQPLLRIDCAYGLTIGLRQSTPFNENFIGYRGYFFCTLSRQCINYLHEYCQENQKIIKYFKSVSVPENLVLQTILLNSKKFKFVNDSQTYSDFSQSTNGHPSVLETKDLPNIFASQKHFARKFDINRDRQVLDLIDSKIMKNVCKTR
ncbi:MAG: beta-1,6-N-acetylglucosaminyltransferase [Pleurocapsa sp.]